MNFQKRRNYYIEKQFQTKYMLLTMLLLLAYTFAFLIIIFAPYILTLFLEGYSLAEKAEASRALLFLHGTVWPGIACVILLFGALSIYVTHKIAGPMYRLKKSIAEITDGNLEVHITLRKGDDLKDLAEHVNMLTGEMRNFVSRLKLDYDLLSDYSKQIEQDIKTKVLTEASGREIINKVESSRKSIEATLEKFKLEQ